MPLSTRSILRHSSRQTPNPAGTCRVLFPAFRHFVARCALVSLVCVIAAFFTHGWTLLGVLLTTLIALRRVLRIKSIRYHLTSQRLKIISGLLSRKIVEIELFRIRDLSVEQGFIHRLLSIGTVRAASSDQDAEDVLLAGIKDAVKVKDILRNFVMESRKSTGTRDLDMTVIGR